MCGNEAEEADAKDVEEILARLIDLLTGAGYTYEEVMQMDLDNAVALAMLVRDTRNAL